MCPEAAQAAATWALTPTFRCQALHVEQLILQAHVPSPHPGSPHQPVARSVCAQALLKGHQLGWLLSPQHTG